MRLGIFEKGGVLANNEVNLTFMEKIKAKQFEDGDLNKLRNKVVYGRPKMSLSIREVYLVLEEGFVFLELVT